MNTKASVNPRRRCHDGVSVVGQDNKCSPGKIEPCVWFNYRTSLCCLGCLRGGSSFDFDKICCQSKFVLIKATVRGLDFRAPSGRRCCPDFERSRYVVKRIGIETNATLLLPKAIMNIYYCFKIQYGLRFGKRSE